MQICIRNVTKRGEEDSESLLVLAFRAEALYGEEACPPYPYRSENMMEARLLGISETKINERPAWRNLQAGLSFIQESLGALFSVFCRRRVNGNQ